MRQLLQTHCLESTTEREDYVAIRGAGNFQHGSPLQLQFLGQAEVVELVVRPVRLRDEISSLTKSGTNFQRTNQAGGGRKRLLLMRSARMRDSNVVRGSRSRAAAPVGPNTWPPLARSASSISAFS
jgi:hypothetical protein